VPRADLHATLGRILGLLRDPHPSGTVGSLIENTP
jgi:hypothetical protein